MVQHTAARGTSIAGRAPVKIIHSDGDRCNAAQSQYLKGTKDDGSRDGQGPLNLGRPVPVSAAAGA